MTCKKKSQKYIVILAVKVIFILFVCLVITVCIKDHSSYMEEHVHFNKFLFVLEV